MQKTLTLNPAYFLRNDIHRCVIGSFEFVDMPEGEYDIHFLHVIHPTIAQFLSFFSNNNKPITQVFDELSKYFLLSFDEIEQIVHPMINNENALAKEIDGTKMLLPRKLLLEDTLIERRENYEPKDFNICGELDMKSVRLFRPIHAVLELTLRCYTDCEYCYADRRINRDVFLPTNLAVSFIEEAHKLEFTDIEINGGEVLLHPGIKEILMTLRRCGYNSLISTKKPVTWHEISFLKGIGMNRLQISLDSLNSETVKKLVHAKDDYVNQMIQTMDLLDQNEFQWQINTVLTKLNCNIDDLSSLIDKLQSYNYLYRMKLSPMGFPMYKKTDTFKELHASKEQLESVRSFVEQIKRQNVNFQITMSDEDKESDYTCKKRELFNDRLACTANQKAFNVLPDGKVTICEELYWNPAFIIGDISKNGIIDIWNSDKAKKLFFINRNMISGNSSCFSCQQLSDCRHHKGVCWKMVIMAYGDSNWDYPDPRCPDAPPPINKYYV